MPMCIHLFACILIKHAFFGFVITCFKFTYMVYGNVILLLSLSAQWLPSLWAVCALSWCHLTAVNYMWAPMFPHLFPWWWVPSRCFLLPMTSDAAGNVLTCAESSWRSKRELLRISSLYYVSKISEDSMAGSKHMMPSQQLSTARSSLKAVPILEVVRNLYL